MVANTVKSRKAKGRKLQQLICALIYAHNPDLWPGDVESTIMGDKGADVKLSPRAKELIPFGIECKNTEKLSIWKAWEQVCARETLEGEPLLCFKRSRSEILVTLRATKFFELLSKVKR